MLYLRWEFPAAVLVMSLLVIGLMSGTEFLTARVHRVPHSRRARYVPIIPVIHLFWVLVKWITLPFGTGQIEAWTHTLFFNLFLGAMCPFAAAGFGVKLRLVFSFWIIYALFVTLFFVVWGQVFARLRM